MSDPRGPWPAQCQPKMSFPQALQLAQEALGPRYYCTSADLSSLHKTRRNGVLTPYGVWAITLTSRSGQRKQVWVEESGHCTVYHTVSVSR